MADLGQQTVEFSTLVRRAAEDSFLSLTELVEKSPEQLDPEKKISLLKYIIKTRQRMLRLHVLAKWCQQIPLVQYCQQLASTLSSHDTCFTQAADSLFFMHEGLQQARAPIYDVPSAIEVLLTGTYQRVPKCIEDVGMRTTLAEDQRKPALKKLDTLLRSRLLEVSIPKDISEVTVSDGTVELRVDGEFKIMLTLGYRGHLSLWRILHIELLVGEKNGLVKLEETRRFGLGDDLERRMAAAENPFMILYSILHEFCVALIMDTVIRQVQTLRQGRWKDAICFELIADGNAGSVQLTQDGEADLGTLKTPGLRIAYWLEFDKNSGGSDLGSAPFIKIEPGQDLQIKCLHSVFVIDPLTGNEAEFFLDQSCIDAEQLLLRAIACNIHTRLLEVHKELGRNCQICQAAGDVVLKCHADEFDAASKKKSNKVTVSECGEEVLCVRAYGSSYITLGINIRNGRFLLQSSRNILAPSLLLECEESLNQGSMAAAEVFIILRHKSILHLFASISRFLGLKVYEHGLAAIKIPKSVINGSDLLLMEFPQCGNSYYLLMQLDKDFKPVFKLLVSQPDACGSSNLVGESNQVSRFNRIDIGQMQIVADEVNLSLLDWERLHSSPQNSGDFNQTSEQGLLADFGLEASTPSARCPQSSFSSLVEDVFEYEKGASQPSTFFIQNHIASSLDMPHLSHIGSVPVSHQGIKAGIGSPKWEGNAQLSHISNAPKVSTSGILFGSSLYPSSSLKGLLQTGPSSSLSSLSPVRSPIIPRLSASKSDQELTSLKSPPHAVDASPSSAMDEDQMRVLNDYPKEVNTMLSGSRQTRLLSPLRGTGSRVATASTKPSGLKSPPSGHLVGSIKSTISSSWTTSPVCQTPESVVSHSSNCDTVVKHIKNQRKRSLSDILNHVPSLQSVEASTQVLKRRKISEAANSASQAQFSSALVCKTEGYTYGNIISEANHGRATSSIYVTILLHVVRHCSLCIMHARLTSQMDALAIPYVEEVGLRNPSSNFWFRLPFTRDDSWQHICLRLGRPGSMSWDVKVNDQHFRDLWELQKENTTTPWGSGVRIANTSDVDSHICYDPEGVVLSYRTVEASSIQKLMADLRRLSNARLFALGMRGLLGVKVDDKTDDGNGSSEIKSQLGAKGIGEITDNKMSEQMRRAFRIEAVGLMSLWFSYFGSMPGIVARFVVEWEAGKEGCTMHVSPDQLWPHTKFLEDFINGAEVASLLDCIHLTAGPLLALAGAIRPARMMGPSPVSSGVHSATTGLQAGTKQNGFIASQGPLSSGLPANIAQNTSGTAVENPIGSTSIMGPVGTHNPHGSAMLSIAGRGGPGIVPSSLLPIDVSVVLRGPYWIRIIYRKNFAVDMRCFAGDQVWLQPATPPKGGPAAGGSLPCPQFRPFIMEHVAQGLNTLESTFTGGSHAVGIGNSNNMILSSGSQQAPSGNRANMVSSGGASRSNAMVGNPGANLSRVNNSMPVVSSLVAVSSGLPLRMAPSTGVPVHVRGELNTAFIGLGDDGGYGGGWVPLAALKKVLRGILKYLGVLWLFAQLPDLLKEILGSILKDNEGTLLNLDQEQPALRFFVGGYVFAVSVHRVQLLLQVLSVRRFHYQQQQQQQQSQANAQDELTPSEISEICDYFSRRVASEPYDASRVASFITLLTLPISVLREFLKLISWKKGLLSPGQGDMAPAQRPRIELCLENHSNSAIGENPGSSSGGSSSSSKSNFIYDRPHNSVDFGLTIVLDPAHIPHINAAGGAAWLPYCVSIRLRYLFGESAHISLLGMEGSHGGQACWLQAEDWERCKQRVARAVEFSRCGTSAVDANQGRLRIVAETLQKALQSSLQQLRDGGATGSSSTVT